jgi:hypothetical protein
LLGLAAIFSVWRIDSARQCGYHRFTDMKPTATGSNTRIHLQRPGQPIAIHATLVTYDPTNGNFTALLDTQSAGAEPIAFTLADRNTFMDPEGLIWIVG